MSTRSNIVAKLSSGKYAAIYTHSDGYPSYNGVMLRDHYKTQEDVDALMGLGDLSCLDKSPHAPPEGHHFDHRAEGFCVAYGRDRGEKDVDAHLFDELQPALDWTDNEFIYLWDPEAKSWSCALGADRSGTKQPDSFVSIDEALKLWD